MVWYSYGGIEKKLQHVNKKVHRKREKKKVEDESTQQLLRKLKKENENLREKNEKVFKMFKALDDKNFSMVEEYEKYKQENEVLRKLSNDLNDSCKLYKRDTMLLANHVMELKKEKNAMLVELDPCKQRNEELERQVFELSASKEKVYIISSFIYFF